MCCHRSTHAHEYISSEHREGALCFSHRSDSQKRRIGFWGVLAGLSKAAGEHAAASKLAHKAALWAAWLLQRRTDDNRLLLPLHLSFLRNNRELVSSIAHFLFVSRTSSVCLCAYKEERERELKSLPTARFYLFFCCLFLFASPSLLAY
jgi:hypothetical protein